MPNIYLRLPSIICVFHRNCDIENKKLPHEPIRFSDFTEHSLILRSGVSVVTTGSRKSPICYSQHEWKNILKGRRPSGGNTILKRDETEWPTFQEICRLEGVKLSNRTESYDFLCIKIPDYLRIGEREVRTNASYVLTQEPALRLQEQLTNDFKRALVNWEIETQGFCISPDRIIHRSHMNTLERFLMKYDIPTARDGYDKNSLRRQLSRWLEKANVRESAYRSEFIEYEDSEDKVSYLNKNSE